MYHDFFQLQLTHKKRETHSIPAKHIRLGAGGLRGVVHFP